jgi:hypothetical protein
MSKRIIFGGSYQSAQYFSDLFGVPTQCFSIRKLTPNSVYAGACIRVRRLSDNVEQDINFVSSSANALLDTASLLSFIGVSSGLIVRMYNQSAVNNFIQTTANAQPRIVNAGTLDTLLSKPSIIFDGINDFLEIASVFTNNTITSFAVASTSNTANNGFLYDNSNSGSNGGGYSLRFLASGGFRTWGQDAVWNASGGATVNNTAYLVNQYSTIPAQETNTLYRNNVLVNTVTSPVFPSSRAAKATTRIGNSEILGGFLNGRISELIAYNSNKLSDLSAMNTNINSFYGIY